MRFIRAEDYHLYQNAQTEMSVILETAARLISQVEDKRFSFKGNSDVVITRIGVIHVMCSDLALWLEFVKWLEDPVYTNGPHTQVRGQYGGVIISLTYKSSARIRN